MTNSTMPAMTGGVSAPLLAYRFRVLVGNPTITASILFCDVNYAAKRVKLGLRDGVANPVHEWIYHVCRDGLYSLTVETLGGGPDQKVYSSIEFIKGSAYDHSVRYDYAAAYHVQHLLTLHFHRLEWR